MFFVFEREERGKKKHDNWNFWFWFFWSKNGRFVTHICFSKKLAETPIFIVFFGCALFGPRCQKKGNFGHPPKKEKIDWNWKAHFLFFFCVCFFFFCFYGGFIFFVVFFWGFKGQVRWPEGPPHLALNPPYFCFCVFFGGGLVFFCGGFKGQVRLPKGPPHLALNFLFCFCFFCFVSVFCFVFVVFFAFPSLLLIEKTCFST